MGSAFHRHPAFLHRLQKGTLGAGHGTIDLVHQHDMVEDRSRQKDELPLFTPEDRQTGDVRRQQVAGALHPPQGQAGAAGQGQGQGGLAQAGQIFNQQMPATEQRHHGQPQGILLALQHVAVQVLQGLMYSGS